MMLKDWTRWNKSVALLGWWKGEFTGSDVGAEPVRPSDACAHMKMIYFVQNTYLKLVFSSP